MTQTNGLRLAVDIGGTFVDAVAFDPQTGNWRLHKAATTPDVPSRGVAAALRGLIDNYACAEEFVHGTTLGLNAILQRRGSEVGIITTAGFADILEIARADVPGSSMYDFQFLPKPPLVSRRRRIGVPGRLDAAGQVITPLDVEAVVEAGRALVSDGVDAIAVCFLHSYANPSSEQEAAAALRAAFPNLTVSISSDISREYREYERTSTVMLDAYIRPILDDYLGDLEAQLTAGGYGGALHVMRSGGGAMTAQFARRAPLTTVLSGPAGGVVGAGHLARELGWNNVISFDVGGTSVDACVVRNGVPADGHEAWIDGLPLQIPVFDIRTIGAGGGSIAWNDGGLLRVGPQSAGAVPGPVCYAAGGTEPTVTDAALVLGYIDASAFLEGEMPLDLALAESAISEKVASPLDLDLMTAAASVFRVLVARTVGAVREITVEQGLDPRDFTLVAFGGAGPLLGPMLGRELGLTSVAVPIAPSAFSAYGMLMSDVEYDVSSTVLAPLNARTLADLDELFADLEAMSEQILADQGIKPESRTLIHRLDLRYQGQEHSLGVEVTAGSSAEQIMAAFGDLHETRYGHQMRNDGEVVTARIRAIGTVEKPMLRVVDKADGLDPRPRIIRPAYDMAREQLEPFAVYDRSSLKAGQKLNGPAIIEEGTSTTVLFSDQVLNVDPYGHLLIGGGAQ